MWGSALAAAIGIWLMIAPAIIGHDEPAATNDRIVGPLVAALGIISLFEITRPVRWVNVALGLWLIVAPAVLGFPIHALWNSVVSGTAIALLSLVRGRTKYRYGGGWSSLWRSSRNTSGRAR